MTTIFQMKEHMAQLGAESREVSAWLAGKAADPTIPIDEVRAKKARLGELEERLSMVTAEHDKAEAAGRAKAATDGAHVADPAQAKIEAKKKFYVAALKGEPVRPIIQAAYTHLGAVPADDADLGYGDRLLPTQMSNELIVEPFEENPMRSVVRLSQITGLEEPKIAFDIDGAYDNVTDKVTANEIEMSGDSVKYGRNKVKVAAKVSDTVIHGTALNLVSEIENALRSGLAINEMNRMFAATPAAGYEQMSFYSTANNIVTITGATKQAAIAAALADLPMSFRRNAKIIMSGLDWFGMWGENLNQSGMYYEDRPLMLFGKQVVLVDDAVKPIVGDFNYARINYDIGTVYDTAKDVDAGIYKYVLTAWYDIQLRLKSAFRIADIAAVMP